MHVCLDLQINQAKKIIFLKLLKVIVFKNCLRVLIHLRIQESVSLLFNVRELKKVSK